MSFKSAPVQRKREKKPEKLKTVKMENVNFLLWRMHVLRAEVKLKIFKNRRTTLIGSIDLFQPDRNGWWSDFSH